MLVADDSPVARYVISAQLRLGGYSVVCAEDGAAAVELAGRTDPDVILLDHHMPKLNGREVLARLLADPNTAEIPVIFLTVLDDVTQVADSLAAGALDYLRKPSEALELLARVGVACRLKRVQDTLRERNRQLETLAFIDALTGLHNRRAANDRLAELLSRARRAATPVSAVLLDIDGFKAINDALGHDGGDRVLEAVAGRLSGRVRREDMLARWGGEEFIVLVGDCDATGAGALAEGLRSVLADVAVSVGASVRSVTASVGHATWTDLEPADTLIRRADAAMYAAKLGGGNRVRAAGPDGPRESVR
ncbi:MAG TPA: diguanylate cyclase [Solirubrobacteraceae bacterium]|nr:diguanylate cyclase [Solirubrobacteraceae bacterium]